MPNPRAQKNPTFIPQALQGLADMGRGAVRGALAEGLGTAGDLTQALSNIKTAGFMPAMLARGLQGPTSEEMSHALRGMTPNPLTQPDRAHTAQMGQTFGSVPASMAGGAGTNAALQKMAGRLNNMQKVESMMPKAPKPVAEVLKGPEPDFMRVYSGQRIPIEGKFDIMRADPHASMGRAFYTAELPRYANKFTGNQPGANVTPVDVDRNRMLMFDKMYDTPQGQMEGLDYYDMLRRQAMVKPGIGKDMIRQEILDAGFAGTQMPNATGKAYAIYDPSVAQDMSGRGFARGGLVDGSSNDDGTGGEDWRNTPGMAAGGVPYRGINPMATGLGQMRQQSVARDAASSLMAKNRAAQFANQGADRLARQNQLAAAKTARLNALAPKLSTYVPPAGSTTTSPTVTSPTITSPATITADSTTPIVPTAKPDDPGNYQGGARGGLVSMAGGGLAKKAADKAFRALPGQSFQGKSGLNMEMPRDVEKRILEMTETGLILPSEALGKHEGKTLMITQADRTKVGEGFLGGPGFSGIQLTDPRYAGATWGVKTPGVGQTIIGSNRRVPEGQAIWTTMLGTPTQHKSNQMVFDRLYKEFMGGVKQEKLTPELKDTLNAKLASAIDKEGKNLFPADVDITNPRKFRKLVDTFDKRAAAADVMGGIGVGGKKGQIFDYDRIIQRTTDPALLEVPTGSLGNRLFQLSGEMMDRPDLHPAFPTILKGEDLGVSFIPAPRELLMEDYINKVLTEKGRQPGYMDWTRGYAPSQFLSEELLTKLQKAGYKKGGKVKKMQAGGIAKAVKSGLQALDKPAKQTITSAIDPSTDLASRLTEQGRTSILPIPNRWFLQPEKFPQMQGLVEKVLQVNNMQRSDFPSGAFVNPRTGEILDKRMMEDVGVVIDPKTNRPIMSAKREIETDLSDRKKGSITKSNLVRRQLYKPEGDPLLDELKFIATIEQSGAGHKYGLGTEYATPVEMFNTMTGENPTLRPKSRGDIFGIGDIVGRVTIGKGQPHDVYESLLVAPKGSDVEGVKLSKKKGGMVRRRK
jgi:hypothetical protein